jgi:hypothetical protein
LVLIDNGIDNQPTTAHTRDMIPRVLESALRQMTRKFPVVTVTGPRQSGKTTLCKATFPDKPYVSLEAPDVRSYAHEDPRGLLSQYHEGAVFDEVHRAPDLLSYIQVLVDERRGMGRFILTGSAHFGLLHSIGQSLAGRTALLHLLPLGLEEVRRFPNAPGELFDLLWRGSYPAIYDRSLDPGEWYPSYVATYLERDVRNLLNVGDLMAFQTFLRLCAARVGHLLNLSSLGSDTGITHATAKSWLSVLEAGWIAWRLMPLHANVSKRLIKTPKLHFLDSGLVSYLLGIRSPAQLRDHPLRGVVFETWVASEILKARTHRGLAPAMSFFRDRKGTEVDVLLELGRSWLAVETKSGQTVAEDFFAGLKAFEALSKSMRPGRGVRDLVVYGGDLAQVRSGAEVLPWRDVDRRAWWEDEELR